MKTTFDNLTIGSRFSLSPDSCSDGSYAEKIDDSHFVFGPKRGDVYYGKPDGRVYPEHPYSLKNPKKTISWFGDLSSDQKMYLCLFGVTFLIVIFCQIFGNNAQTKSEPPPTADEVIARKLANGEELNWIEKKVVKERQEEGRKRSEGK